MEVGIANGPALPPSTPLTRNGLASACDSGLLPVPAWKVAMNFCGFVPDKNDWLTYWRNIFILGGTVFLLAGVMFFIAWNWDGMHRIARMLFIGFIVAGAGAGALAKGLDSRIGHTLLLSCGIAVGPMLAVFGQSYQTGSELWELFRIWTIVLILLALAARQAGLWFAAWISGNIFVNLWLGRDLAEPLEALWFFSVLPEAIFALLLCLILWEYATWKLASSQKHSWLRSRWLPRLLFFDFTCRATLYLCGAIFSYSGWRVLPELSLPHMPVIPILAIMAYAASWYWHRKRTPDLFMLACVLSSLAVLLVAWLLQEEFLFKDGVGAIFIWGLIIVGLTAAIGKILFHTERSLGRKAGGKSGYPFWKGSCSCPNETWESLWGHLQGCGLITHDTPLPGPPILSPWYVRALLAFGGWVAAVLFLVFFIVLFVFTLNVGESFIRSGLIICAVLLLVGGAKLLRLSGVFTRHLGFAIAVAGTLCGIVGITLMVGAGSAVFFLVAVFLVSLCYFLSSVPFRFLASTAGVSAVALGVVSFGYDYHNVGNALFSGYWEAESLWPVYTTIAWWTPLALAMVRFRLHEEDWRGTGRGQIVEPMLNGIFAGMLLFQVVFLSAIFAETVHADIILGVTRSVAVGAATGIAYLAWELTRKNRHMRERAGVLLTALMAFPLAWFLPGAAVGFLGLALANLLGSLVMRGMVAAFFFVYMVYYYYFLGISFLSKSVLLASSGVVLIGLGFCLGRHAALYGNGGQDSA